MALATKCPHCNTVFRVAHDQLKLRGGIVRCGHCNEVFDGNAALLAPPAAAPLPATPATPPAPASAPLPTPTPAVSTSAPQVAEETDHTPHDPLADLPQLAIETAHEASAEQAAAPTAPPEPEPELEPRPDPTAQPLPAPTPFDAKMDALDTRAAEVLQSEPAASEPELELDTAIELDAEADSGETPASPYQGIADPLELPPAPALAPAAAELPLELNLDIETEPAASTAAPASAAAEPDGWLDLPPEPAPAVADLPSAAEPEVTPTAEELATPWEAAPASATASAPALEQELALESMSDAELEAALAAELAVMERNIGASAEPNDAGDVPARSDARIEPSFDALDDDEDTLVELSSASQQAGKAPAAQTSAELDLLLQPARTTEAAASADAAHGEEPGFIKRDRRRQKYGKAVSIAMALGSVALVGTLGIQGVTTFRNQLAAAMPPLKPALTAACNALGCKIELPAQIDDLNIEQGELQTLSDTTFSFNTLLRNQSATAQSWPHIELVLDDANDKAVLRRVFTPRDYLGPDVPLDKGFAPHTEQAVKLFFELNQLKASGYHIAVFYP